MTAACDVETSLASKCMDFCQALARQGQAFSFSLAIGPNFSFSLDTRSKAVKEATGTATKKKSPSTLRRNAMRREEFLKKKQTNPSGRIPLEEDSPASASDRPQCDQCEYKASSEKGLRQHVRMKHKEQACATPEKARRPLKILDQLSSPQWQGGEMSKLRGSPLPWTPVQRDPCGSNLQLLQPQLLWLSS